MKKILLLSTIFIAATACTQKEYTYYSKGVVLTEREVKDGVPHGTSKAFSPDGKVIEQAEYKHGKKEGASKQFYENGNVRSIQYFKDDKENGKIERYYENGKIEYKGNYINGKRNGVFESYYENGKLNDSIEYDNGNYNGHYKEFFEDGSLKIQREYLSVDGQTNIVNDFIENFENGNIKVKGQKNNKGEYVGETIKYYENGNIALKIIFDNNIPTNIEAFNEDNSKLISFNPNSKENISKIKEMKSGANPEKIRYNVQCYKSGKVTDKTITYRNIERILFQDRKPSIVCYSSLLFDI